MANLASNPWSFASTDPAIATITGATGLTLNADRTVTITTTAGFTFNTSSAVEPALGFTVINATAAAYNGFYKLISGASGATSFVMQPQFAIAAGTAQSGAGTIAQCLYRSQIRIEDMSWQAINPAAGVASGAILLVDRSGNIIWQSAIGVTATFGQLNRGKVFWVNGLTPVTIPANSLVLVTVN